MLVFQNVECGNIFDTYEEAFREGVEMYDIGDPTNLLGFWDYYRVIEI